MDGWAERMCTISALSINLHESGARTGNWILFQFFKVPSRYNPDCYWSEKRKTWLVFKWKVIIRRALLSIWPQSIAIPVKDVDSWAKRMRKLLYFWILLPFSYRFCPPCTTNCCCLFFWLMLLSLLLLLLFLSISCCCLLSLWLQLLFYVFLFIFEHLLLLYVHVHILVLKSMVGLAMFCERSYNK